jgi:hypothetical protein
MKTDPKRGLSALRRSMTAEQWARHWQTVQAAAQHDTHTEIGGKVYARLPYGTKGDDSHKFTTCSDCAVEIGQFHVAGCDGEICPACGGRALGCDCGCGEREVH